MMNLTMINSLIENKDNCNELKTKEIISSIPFISSFAMNNGEEYLPSLFHFCLIQTFKEGDTIDITNTSEFIFIYLTGSFNLFNNSNGEELSTEHITFGQSIIISHKQRLYNTILIKMQSISSFILIQRKKYETLLETISIEKTQKIARFTSTIKVFKLFYNLKKNLYEKLYQISKEKTYKRKEIVYEEHEQVDGIYFILSGSFLLTKRLPYETEEDKLKKIDRELKYLSKEGEFYLQCLNNKLTSNSKEMMKMKTKLRQLSNENCSLKPNKSNRHSTLLTKIQSSVINLTILNENNMFGDIEFISREKTRTYTVQCISESSYVVYFPIVKFREICTESLLEKICLEVLKKANLFSAKYYSDIHITENKVLLKEYSKIPVDINRIKLRRNAFGEEREGYKEVKTAFKAFKTSCVKFKLPAVQFKHNSTTYVSNEKEFSMSHLKINSQNDTASLLKQKLEHDKTNSAMPEKSCTKRLLTETNQTPSTKIMRTFAQKPFLKNNYKETRIKYPFSLFNTKLNKRKLSFHFNSNVATNMKKVLIENNISEVELCYKW